MTEALGHHVAAVEKIQGTAQPLSASADHFMPTVLWSSKGGTQHREMKPRGQAVPRRKAASWLQSGDQQQQQDGCW